MKELDEAVALLSGLLEHHDSLTHRSDVDEIFESPTWCLTAEAARFFVESHGVRQPKPAVYGTPLADAFINSGSGEET